MSTFEWYKSELIKNTNTLMLVIQTDRQLETTGDDIRHLVLLAGFIESPEWFSLMV